MTRRKSQNLKIGKNSPSGKLLFDQMPLIILPQLAEEIGLPEAIVLQQLHYWLQTSTHEHDGRIWVFNSMPEWHEQFPFYSLNTIRRTFQKLRSAGFVLVGNYNRRKYDKTIWYAIDYDRLSTLSSGLESKHPNRADEDTQNGHMDVPSLSKPIPENTRDNTERSHIADFNKEAEVVYSYYTARVKTGGRSVAVKTIANLLRHEFTTEQLCFCIDQYAAKDMRKQIEFRFRAENFFGKDERYKDYLPNAGVSGQSRILGRPSTQQLLAKRRKERNELTTN